jgi:hypothetical protein
MGGCCYSGKAMTSRREEEEEKNTLNSDSMINKQDTMRKKRDLNNEVIDEISEKDSSNEEHDLIDRSQDFKSYTHKTDRSDKKLGSHDDLSASSIGERTYKTPKFGKDMGTLRSYSNTLGDSVSECKNEI